MSPASTRSAPLRDQTLVPPLSQTAILVCCHIHTIFHSCTRSSPCLMLHSPHPTPRTVIQRQSSSHVIVTVIHRQSSSHVACDLRDPPPSNSQHVPPSHPRLRGRQLRVNTSGGLAPGCTLTRTRRCRREGSRSEPGTAPQGCCAVSHTHSRDGDARRVEHPPRGSRAGARWTPHSSWHTAR